jgi:hypothetical protein
MSAQELYDSPQEMYQTFLPLTAFGPLVGGGFTRPVPYPSWTSAFACVTQGAALPLPEVVDEAVVEDDDDDDELPQADTSAASAEITTSAAAR